MTIQYDRATILRLMEDLSQFQGSFALNSDALAQELDACRASYTRLCSQIEVLLNQARRSYNDAESRYYAASAAYDAAQREASASEEDSDRQDADNRASQALSEMNAAQADMNRAMAEIQVQEAKLQKVERAWASHGPAAESGMRALEEQRNNASFLVRNANQDLGQFMQMMEQAKADLYGDPAASVPHTTATGITAAGASSTGGSSGGGAVMPGQSASGFVSEAPAGERSSGSSASSVSGASVGSAVGVAAVAAGAALAGHTAGRNQSRATGWCAKNSMQAVACDGGQKSLSLSIGGAQHVFSCDKNGLALAYEKAMDAGDDTLVERLSAMFEIETLREDLELQSGDPAFAQLGGYHRDVRSQDPSGYESHHIPSCSTQDEAAGWLPTIAITAEDHSQTSSYRGKQGRSYTSYFSPSEPAVRYKDEISQKIAQGGAGYVEALRNELWDLRVCTGHRYDGGISAFLDAVIDLFATRGIPGSK